MKVPASITSSWNSHAIVPRFSGLMLRRADVEPRNRLVASSLEAVKRCVEAGLGVTLVPSIAVERELADGTLVELPLEETEGFDYGFVLCTRAGERPTPPVAALLEILRAGA